MVWFYQYRGTRLIQVIAFLFGFLLLWDKLIVSNLRYKLPLSARCLLRYIAVYTQQGPQVVGWVLFLVASNCHERLFAIRLKIYYVLLLSLSILPYLTKIPTTIQSFPIDKCYHHQT